MPEFQKRKIHDCQPTILIFCLFLSLLYLRFERILLFCISKTGTVVFFLFGSLECLINFINPTKFPPILCVTGSQFLDLYTQCNTLHETCTTV